MSRTKKKHQGWNREFFKRRVNKFDAVNKENKQLTNRRERRVSKHILNGARPRAETSEDIIVVNMEQALQEEIETPPRRIKKIPPKTKILIKRLQDTLMWLEKEAAAYTPSNNFKSTYMDLWRAHLAAQYKERAEECKRKIEKLKRTAP